MNMSNGVLISLFLQVNDGSTKDFRRATLVNMFDGRATNTRADVT